VSVRARREFIRTGSLAAFAAGLGAARGAAQGGAPAPPQIVWTFDRLDAIGGMPTRVEGDPVLIDSPFGRAVKFDGVDDALFIDQHPLAGAATFTLEALFRPDGGAFEQRWLHLAQEAPDTGAAPGTPASSRIMFEIRVVEGGWYLDAFTKGPNHSRTLALPDKLHPIGRWTHVAQTCDGNNYRSYVDGALEGEAAIDFTPQGPGRTSVGTRINRVSYFNGALREARFTPRALTPAAFTTPLA
jgi:hypothetical protein